MAEVAVERQGELVRSVFEVLMGSPEGLPAREVIATVEARPNGPSKVSQAMIGSALVRPTASNRGW